jgi:hypothetical protein
MIKYILIFFFLGALNSNAATHSEIIHAVAMEASGEPYLAQVGICAVIRTRNNSLKGIYGAKANRLELKKVYLQIEKAWAESKTNDITHGCNLFGGIIDDKYFQNKLGLRPVLTIGHTRFYKSK